MKRLSTAPGIPPGAEVGSVKKGMTRTHKTDMALAALLQRYVAGYETALKRTLSPKQRRALTTIARKYFRLREELAESGAYEPLSCTCKLDRLVLVTDELNVAALARIPGFRNQNRHRLWNQGYRWAQRIHGTGSIEEVVVEFERTATWFSPYRLTIVPRDTDGLQEHDLRLVLENMEKFKITILEVAWDLPAECVVDLDYVRRFALFGKTWLRPSGNGTLFHERWGTSASKVVRAYVKWETFHFRIELELHTDLLRKEGIRDIFDFRKLPDVLVPKHIEFSKLDEAKLIGELQHSGRSSAEARSILIRARRKAASRLWTALRFLRKDERLKNVRRLLTKNDETSRVFREAIETLVAGWPAQPARLARTP